MEKMKLTKAIFERRHIKTNSYFAETNELKKDIKGEAFRIAFDEVFKILYCDLKIISGACEWR